MTELNHSGEYLRCTYVDSRLLELCSLNVSLKKQKCRFYAIFNEHLRSHLFVLLQNIQILTLH